MECLKIIVDSKMVLKHSDILTPKIRKTVDKIMKKYSSNKYFRKIDLINKVIYRCGLQPSQFEKNRVRTMINAWLSTKEESNLKKQKKGRSQVVKDSQEDVQLKMAQSNNVQSSCIEENKPELKKLEENKPYTSENEETKSVLKSPLLIDLTLDDDIKKEETSTIEKQQNTNEQIQIIEQVYPEPILPQYFYTDQPNQPIIQYPPTYSPYFYNPNMDPYHNNLYPFDPSFNYPY